MRGVWGGLTRRAAAAVLLLLPNLLLLVTHGSVQTPAQATATTSSQTQSPSPVAAGPSSEEPPCTTGLRDAINSAISKLLAEHFFANELLPRYRTVPYVPFLGCPPYPTSGDSGFWPALDTLHPSDLLLQVLARKTLRVASYGPPPPLGKAHPEDPKRLTAGYNWGDEADYSQDPPQGFLPDYLRRLVETIGSYYGTELSVEWYFYPSGVGCTDAVMRGEVDMTDIYFLQGLPEMVNPQVSLEENKAARMLHRFYRTCPVVASSIVFVCLESLGVRSLQDVATYIRNRFPEEATVAYLTPANKQSLHFLLPEKTQSVILSREAALSAVREKEIMGVFMTGSVARREKDGLKAVHTHVFTSMGPWLRRTDTPGCLAHRFQTNLSAAEDLLPFKAVTGSLSSSATHPTPAQQATYLTLAAAAAAAAMLLVGA